MRCRCCNVPLMWRNFNMKQDDGSEEDFCTNCINVVYNIEQFEPKTYVFERECDPFYVPEVYSE